MPNKPASEYQSIPQGLADAARRWPEHGYTFQNLSGAETFISFADMQRETTKRAARLVQLGLRKGDRLGMVVIEPEEFVLTFFASLRAGVVPVPCYPPLGLGDFDAYNRRTGRLMRTCGARMVFTSRRLENVLWTWVSDLPSLERIITPKIFEQPCGSTTYPEVGPDDIALLQYTSGSTARPRGVILTHRCIMANCRGILGPTGLQATSGDRGVTWLPLYHDMGLIGFVVAPILAGICVVFIPTIRFLRDPTTWMDTVHRHRATISFGPNFSYGFVARRATAEQLVAWDLSCLKTLGCGGEPVDTATIDRFSTRFSSHCRLKPGIVRPGYGLAEGTLTTSLTPMDETLRVNVVDAERFRADRIAEPAGAGPSLVHVACGVCIPDHQVAIIDERGRHLPEGSEGEIIMQGASVSPGYFDDEEATARTFRNGWLHTGDLGYLLDGHIYVTGRIKDLIITHGRNYHPQSLEWPIGNLPQVRTGNVVAFAVSDGDTEVPVVVVETTTDGREALLTEIRRVVHAETGLMLHDIVLVDKNTLPKTSSGKLQRHLTRQLYLTGALGQSGARITSGRTARINIAKQLVRSLWVRLSHSLRRRTAT